MTSVNKQHFNASPYCNRPISHCNLRLMHKIEEICHNNDNYEHSE